MLNTFEREDLSIGCLEKTAHIIPSDFEASASYTGNHIVRTLYLVPECSKSLHARNFVACSAIIFSELGLNNHARIEFIRDDEVWRLVKSRHPFSAFRFTIAYTR